MPGQFVEAVGMVADDRIVIGASLPFAWMRQQAAGTWKPRAALGAKRGCRKPIF